MHVSDAEHNNHVRVGYYASPMQFVSKAKAVQHPMDVHNPVSDVSRAAIFEMLTCNPADLALMLNSVFCIPAGCYFEDFPSIQPDCLSRSAKLSSKTLLKVLGWRFAEAGDKCIDYAETFHVLGAQVDLAGLCVRTSEPNAGVAKRNFVASNMPGRPELICRILDEAFVETTVLKRDLAIIRGHLKNWLARYRSYLGTQGSRQTTTDDKTSDRFLLSV